MQLRPADIAKECTVSVGTVRSWCTEFSEFLSAGANPTDGDRKLNEDDLKMCKRIAQLRKAGMSKAQIILRLRETAIEKSTEKPTEALQIVEESPQETPQATVVALDDLDRRDAQIETLNRLIETQAEQLREKQDIIEQLLERQRETNVLLNNMRLLTAREPVAPATVGKSEAEIRRDTIFMYVALAIVFVILGLIVWASWR